MNEILNEEILKAFLVSCEEYWGARPFATLACAGESDEHWQVWHPADLAIGIEAPRFTICDGIIECHPDNPVQEVLV